MRSYQVEHVLKKKWRQSFASKHSKTSVTSWFRCNRGQQCNVKSTAPVVGRVMGGRTVCNLLSRGCFWIIVDRRKCKAISKHGVLLIRMQSPFHRYFVSIGYEPANERHTWQSCDILLNQCCPETGWMLCRSLLTQRLDLRPLQSSQNVIGHTWQSKV